MVGFLLLLIPYVVLASTCVRPAGMMLYRLRWLFVSLLVVYGWFTPGRLLGGHEGLWWSALMPTFEGLVAGLARTAALVMIVLAVNILLRTTSRDQLLSAVYDMARPLAPLGIPPERVALRMVLVMDSLESVRQVVVNGLATRLNDVKGLRSAGEFASDLMIDVMERADRNGQENVVLTMDTLPRFSQWAYPILLLAVFFAAGSL